MSAAEHLRTWMRTPDLDRLFQALGHTQARFVGGCVRDSLLGVPFADIDVASMHEPSENLARLKQAGFKVIPTGLAHGTVTALTDVGPVEVTSLREDLETDGRHAVVRFSGSWWRDAQRRDLTMNALFLSQEGQIYDPLGQGLLDLQQGRVRFIGDAATRIDEDRLRLLRFFRFAAKYARQPLDKATLQVCHDKRSELASLSGERVQTELFKMLGQSAPKSVLQIIHDLKICEVFWPQTQDLSALFQLIDVPIDPSPVLRLRAWIGGTRADRQAVRRRLKLSSQDGHRLTQDLPQLDNQALLKDLYRFGRQTCIDALALSGCWTSERHHFFDKTQVPGFPLQGRHLIELGWVPGPSLGATIKAVEGWWFDQDFEPDLASCLAQAETLKVQS